MFWLYDHWKEIAQINLQIAHSLQAHIFILFFWAFIFMHFFFVKWSAIVSYILVLLKFHHKNDNNIRGKGVDYF